MPNLGSRTPRGGSANPPRWTLTAEEQERLNALRAQPLRLRDLLALALQSRVTAREITKAVVAGAMQGVAADGRLVWLLDRERARRTVPGAATGAAWSDADEFVEPLVPLLGANMRVLDLGCGAGRIARLVAPHVRELVCVDVSETLLNEARENLAAYDNVRFVATRGYRLPEFADRSFDVVYAQGVFAYFDPLQALALLDEIARVLTPGGQSVLNVTTIDQPAAAVFALKAARSAARRNRFGASQFRPYTAEQVCALHTAVGLRVVDQKGVREQGAFFPTSFLARKEAGRNERLIGESRGSEGDAYTNDQGKNT